MPLNSLSKQPPPRCQIQTGIFLSSSFTFSATFCRWTILLLQKDNSTSHFKGQNFSASFSHWKCFRAWGLCDQRQTSATSWHTMCMLVTPQIMPLLSARLEHLLLLDFPFGCLTSISNSIHRFHREVLSPTPPHFFPSSPTSKQHHQLRRFRPESWSHPWFLSPSTTNPLAKYS